LIGGALSLSGKSGKLFFYSPWGLRSGLFGLVELVLEDAQLLAHVLDGSHQILGFQLIGLGTLLVEASKLTLSLFQGFLQGFDILAEVKDLLLACSLGGHSAGEDHDEGKNRDSRDTADNELCHFLFLPMKVLAILLDTQYFSQEVKSSPIVKEQKPSFTRHDSYRISFWYCRVNDNTKILPSKKVTSQ